MWKQIPTDERREQVLSILYSGHVRLVYLLIQIDFPDIPTKALLGGVAQNFHGDTDILSQLGYREETQESQKVTWTRRLFCRCAGCSRLSFGAQQGFLCGHKICSSCAVPRFCPACGPLFAQGLNLLTLTRSHIPRIVWPDHTRTLREGSSLACLNKFAESMVETHREALKGIPVETLVSFALCGSTSHLAPFLKSYEELAYTVETTSSEIALHFAWIYASREACHVDFLIQAIQKGMNSQSTQWNALNLDDNDFYLHTLEPIRMMYRIYSLPEFLKRLPLLSRRLARTGQLDTDFQVFDEITGVITSGSGECGVESWVERSYRALEAAVMHGNGPIQSPGYLRRWSANIAQEVTDICAEYPDFVQTFRILMEYLQTSGDFLSCGAITDGLRSHIEPNVAEEWLRVFRLQMKFNRPCIPLVERDDDLMLFDGFVLEHS